VRPELGKGTASAVPPSASRNQGFSPEVLPSPPSTRPLPSLTRDRLPVRHPTRTGRFQEAAPKFPPSNRTRHTPKKEEPTNHELSPEYPPVVVEFKKQIRAADAILFATPEYDCCIPGVLKNAIDWTKPLGNSRSSCCKISWIGPIASGSELRAGKVFIHLLQPRSLVTQNEPSAFDAD
jgi:hypothetical protein